MKTLEQIIAQEQNRRVEGGDFGIVACKESIEWYLNHGQTIDELLDEYIDRANNDPLFNNRMVLAAWEVKNEMEQAEQEAEKQKTTVKTYNNRWNGTEITGETDGWLNYRTVANSLSSMILCNDITNLFYSTINNEYIEPEIVNGWDYDEETDEYREFYQYYIIGGTDYDLAALKRIGETVYYIEKLDLYIWAVDHFGTAWDGVSTGYRIENTTDIDEYLNDFYLEKRY